MALTTFTNKIDQDKLHKEKLYKEKIYNDRIHFIKASNPSFWIPFAVTTIVLLLTVIFIADYNIRQSETVIGNQIAERGKRTMLLYEAIVLGEIKFNTPINKKGLIKNLGDQKDFDFLAITDKEGKFLIHSNHELIGKNIRIDNVEKLEKSFLYEIMDRLPNTDGEGTSWGFVEVNDKQLFLIHRIFSENLEQSKLRDQYPEINIKLENHDVTHIFAAIQPTHLNNALTRYQRTTFTMSLWVVSISSLSLWIFSFAYRVKSNKKRMFVAETTINAMHEEVQRLESEMQKQEKLVAIGNLAAGVAHEIRNPLSSIKGYATYFASLFPEKSDNQKAAHIMISEVERLNRVIGDLIGVSRPTDIETENISIKSIIEGTIQLLSQDAKQLGIELNIHGADKVVHVDPDRLRQAFINILLNALEAFKDRDILDHLDTPKVGINLSETQNDVFIEITDNGPGIDEKNIRRIFDPYFTTKNQGTGLGLVNSTKIIEAHGGSISVKSTKNIGTSFIIQIPKKHINHSNNTQHTNKGY